MLIIFGGLPGAGKSTLASALAHHLSALYVRIDTIEQAIRNSGLPVEGPAGYMVDYDLARENLRLGTSVVADSVNPLTITRQAWRGVALQAQVSYVEIEVVCSDAQQHRARIESRQSSVPNLKLPRWQQVRERHYEHWPEPHIVLDTAGHSPDQSIAQLVDQLAKMREKAP